MSAKCITAIKNSSIDDNDRRYGDRSTDATVKQSIGIICIKFNNNKPEVLMVCKRYTYSYSDFLHGKYPQGDFRKNSSAKNELLKLFNGMTVEEKLDILSLDFEKMWYRVWLNGPRPHFFFIAKSRFESTFLVDNGVRLAKLISKSSHAQKVWEMPKGRKKSKSEPDLSCAIREFAEETNISKRSYRIIPGLKRTYGWTCNNIKYVNTYFTAIANHDINLSINFNTHDQINEVGDIRWMNIECIRSIDFSGRLETFIKPILRTVKKLSKIRV